MHRLPLSPGNFPGTLFYYRPSQPQGHGATGRIMSMKKSNDTIGNRTRDLPACSAVPQPTVPPHTPSEPDKVYNFLVSWLVISVFSGVSQCAAKCWGNTGVEQVTSYWLTHCSSLPVWNWWQGNSILIGFQCQHDRTERLHCTVTTTVLSDKSHITVMNWLAILCCIHRWFYWKRVIS